MLNIDNRQWITFALITVALFGMLTHSTGRRLDARQQKHKETPLHEAMERVGESYAKLRRQIDDPAKNEDSLKLLTTMQKGAATSLGLVPEKMMMLLEKDRGEFILAFKKQIVALISNMLDIEAALLNSENAKAKEALKKLRTIKRKGHQQFQLEEEH